MGDGGGWKILPESPWGGDREKCVFCRLTFFSPLGLRTEIWTRYYLEIARNCVTRLFGFHQNLGNHYTTAKKTDYCSKTSQKHGKNMCVSCENTWPQALGPLGPRAHGPMGPGPWARDPGPRGRAVPASEQLFWSKSVNFPQPSNAAKGLLKNDPHSPADPLCRRGVSPNYPHSSADPFSQSGVNPKC